MNYPFIIPADPAQSIFISLGVWICPSSASGYNKTIYLICTNPDVPVTLVSHFADLQCTRWFRLQKQPLWIFADLLHVFGDWSPIWNTTKQKITAYNLEIYKYPLTRPLLDLTKDLHAETAGILSVREELRGHSSALTQFLSLKEAKEAPEVIERVKEHLDDINYHEETSQVIFRQFENMMSLAFNIETMTQGQAVARMNVLAFAFLPLSWVASIFGMTKFSTSAARYPLWAFVALLSVILVPLTLPVGRIYGHVLRVSTPPWLHVKALRLVLRTKLGNYFSRPSDVIHADPEADPEGKLPRSATVTVYGDNVPSPQNLMDRIGGAVDPRTPAVSQGSSRKSSSPLIEEDEKDTSLDLEAQSSAS